MKYFLSFKFTGIGISTLHERIDPLMNIIKDNNNKAFCSLYSEDMYKQRGYKCKQIMDHCFSELKTSDVCICYVEDFFSSGMAVEVGFAYANNIPIIICIPKHKSKSGTVHSLITHRIEYENCVDLHKQLSVYISKK